MAIEAVVTHTLFYQPNAQTNDLKPALEIAWQISPRTIRYNSNAEKNIVARVLTDILISNETGVVTHDQFILNTPPRKTVDELATLNLLDQRRYNVTTGSIKIRLQFTDVSDTSNKFVYTDSIKVNEAPSNPFFSGVLLIDTAIASGEPSNFQKNGKLYFPLPTNFIDEPKRTLHYYAEAYNTNKITSSPFLIQKAFISKTEKGGVYNNLVKTDTILPQQLLSVSGSLPITSLGSGNYYLFLQLQDTAKKEIASQKMFFQRLNAHPVVETVKKVDLVADTSFEKVTVIDLSKTFLSKYSTIQLKAILKMLLPISDATSTAAIKGFLKKPEDTYMRYFIYNYFVAINKKDPGRAWKEYTEKVLKVNKLFTTGGVAGYETQRGFMYLRYGEPTDIITVQNETGALPYEVWQYNTLTQMNKKEIANAVFLFYRPNRIMGDYELLHTNVTGELVNPAWRSYLYIGSQGGSNGNSRAEQYIGDK